LFCSSGIIFGFMEATLSISAIKGVFVRRV